MKTFYISIKHGEKIFGYFDKYVFDLNTSKNIVKQAEEKVNSILESFNIPNNARSDFSWKVFRGDANKYMFVSRSINWMDD